MRYYFFLLTLFLAKFSYAQVNLSLPPEHLLQDFNGDGQIKILAFGDSITKGEGDFIAPDEEVHATGSQDRPAGYPLRLEAYLGLDVKNFGEAGESLALESTLSRYIAAVLRERPDVIIIAEGSNDSRLGISPSLFYRELQKVINIGSAYGAIPVLTTVISPCCNHNFVNFFVHQYNPNIHVLSIVNSLQLADANKAFTNTCTYQECYLLNRPEGLHPNIVGYDVLGEVMLSTLLKINLFAPDGPQLLSQAIGIPVTDIKTVPDAVLAQ